MGWEGLHISASSLTTLLSILFGLPLSKDDDQDTEEVNEVNEKQEWVLDVILFSHSVLFNDESRIVADESTHGEEEEIDIDVKEEFGSNE